MSKTFLRCKPPGLDGQPLKVLARKSISAFFDLSGPLPVATRMKLSWIFVLISSSGSLPKTFNCSGSKSFSAVMVMGGSAPIRWRLNQLKAGTRRGCVSLWPPGVMTRPESGGDGSVVGACVFWLMTIYTARSWFMTVLETSKSKASPADLSRSHRLHRPPGGQTVEARLPGIDHRLSPLQSSP